jgi:hypothetical protein
MVGELYVADAVPVLEEMVRLDYDANITVLAKAALDEIRRVSGLGTS